MWPETSLVVGVVVVLVVVVVVVVLAVVVASLFGMGIGMVKLATGSEQVASWSSKEAVGVDVAGGMIRLIT